MSINLGLTSDIFLRPPSSTTNLTLPPLHAMCQSRICHTPFSGAERVDETGMPLQIRSEVYVNMVIGLVPYTLCDFDQDELAEIKEKGAYTRDFANVFPPLRPARVQRDLRELQDDMSRSLLDACQSDSVAPGQLTLRAIMRALCGRRNINPGGPCTNIPGNIMACVQCACVVTGIIHAPDSHTFMSRRCD